MVHGLSTPLFFENNKKLLLNGKVKHLDLIKLGLQTCHRNSQNKKIQPNTKILNNLQTSTCNFFRKTKNRREN
jgi:hypothetical protein